MCALLGQLQLSSLDSADLEKFESSLNLMKHRGPDHTGLKVLEPKGSARILLGHQRLSIIDLSRQADQPFCMQQDELCLVFNGEIYNYLELRNQLIAKGHVFTTQSDTEVLLVAYREYGKNLLDHLNGMFSFLIIDLNKKSALAARDRFGIKPLYYSVDGGSILLSSEIKPLLKIRGEAVAVNRSQALDFLQYGIVNQSRSTLFQGVQQVMPGEKLEINLQTLHIDKKLWYQPIARGNQCGSYAEWKTEFYRLFNDSLKLHLRADVPLGACLSGGMDSSSIVANLMQEEGLSLKTFSALYPGTAFDETSYVEALGKVFPFDSYRTQPNLDKIMSGDELNKLIWHQEEPFSTTSIVAQWSVMQLAHEQGVKIVLDGQGADEILAGYQRYIISYLAGHLRRLKWIRFARDLVQFKKSTFSRGMSGLRIFARSVLAALNLSYYRKTTSYDSLFFRGSGAKGTRQYFTSVDEHLKYDLLHDLQSLLRYEDRNSMAFSLESRVPFLDFRLVEHCLAAKPEWRFKKGISKTILRERENPIPQVIRDRSDKIGFMTPGVKWVEDNKNTIIDEIQKAADQSLFQGMLDQVKLKTYLSATSQDSHFLFRLWLYTRWHQVFSQSLDSYKN